MEENCEVLNTPKRQTAFITTIFIVICCIVYILEIRDTSIIEDYAKNNEKIIYEHEFFRLITCTVLHSGILHIFSNMCFFGRIW